MWFNRISGAWHWLFDLGAQVSGFNNGWVGLAIILIALLVGFYKLCRWIDGQLSSKRRSQFRMLVGGSILFVGIGLGVLGLSIIATGQTDGKILALFSRPDSIKMARRWYKLSKDIQAEVQNFLAAMGTPNPVDLTLSEDKQRAQFKAENDRLMADSIRRMGILNQKFYSPLAQARQEIIDRNIPIGALLQIESLRPTNHFGYLMWANKLAAEGGKILSEAGQNPDEE